MIKETILKICIDVEGLKYISPTKAQVWDQSVMGGNYLKNVIWWFQVFIGLLRVVSWNDHEVPPTVRVLLSHLARLNGKLMKGQLSQCYFANRQQDTRIKSHRRNHSALWLEVISLQLENLFLNILYHVADCLRNSTNYWPIMNLKSLENLLA